MTDLFVYPDSPQTPQSHHPTNLRKQNKQITTNDRKKKDYQGDTAHNRDLAVKTAKKSHLQKLKPASASNSQRRQKT